MNYKASFWCHYHVIIIVETVILFVCFMARYAVALVCPFPNDAYKMLIFPHLNPYLVRDDSGKIGKT